MKYALLLITISLLYSCETKKEGKLGSFPTRFETSEGRETATYDEVIDFYIRLAREFPQINVQTLGETDSGHPLHLVTFNPESDFNFQKISRNKLVLLINNGIHPGESDGIDATMLLFRDYALGHLPPPGNTVLATIPVYNVGGALNRNGKTRVNQNGPESYGFRGNALNYDLNRDFVKSNTRNARTFARIFHTVNPDLFVDTHVSNGADYQYTLTHLFTQHDKLGAPLGDYITQKFLPRLKDTLDASGWKITPYVNVEGGPPDNGFVQFMDSPRYSTGYTALWNTLGVMLETHMLKPYGNRVKGTYAFLLAMVKVAESQFEAISKVREATGKRFADSRYYPLKWQVDSTRADTLLFHGYRVDTLTSNVTGLPRLKYDRTKPYAKDIPYWDNFSARDSVAVPRAYLIKKDWRDIITLLDINAIQYTTLDKDTVLTVESYSITGTNTSTRPYEGHYPHFGTTVSSRLQPVSFGAGDYLIPTSQPGLRYLLETLEPEAVDSFFNWNFFDTTLQQKEYFSSYVFEDLAAELLVSDEALRREFEERKNKDAEFAADGEAQLQWIYDNSPYREEAYLRYPVFRLPAVVPEVPDAP